MKLRLVLWAIKNHKFAWGLTKVIRGLDIKDGFVWYTSKKILRPDEIKIIDNIKPDKTITITADDGGVNISGYVGGK